MSKSLNPQQSKNQGRSHSLSGKNYMKLGRNINKMVFSPLKSPEGQNIKEKQNNEESQFETFIDTPFSLDFLKNQQSENSKYSMSKHPNQKNKPVSALNQNSGTIDGNYMNLNATWNQDDSFSIDEEENSQENLLKLQRKLKRKRKEMAVFKSVERNILPSWVKAKQPEKSYEFKYQIDLSPIKAKSPNAVISKQQNFSLKRKSPQPRPYDPNIIVQVCNKNPLVKLDQISQSLAQYNEDYIDNQTKYINEIDESNQNKLQTNIDSKNQYSTPKGIASIELNNTFNSQVLQNTSKRERAFLSVNNSRNTSPDRLNIQKDLKQTTNDSPNLKNKDLTIRNPFNFTVSTTCYQSNAESKNFQKKRVEYKFNQLSFLEELEQNQTQERQKQKQINIPQIGKYSIRKPLFTPRNTSNEVFTHDLIRENYINQQHQISKIRDFSAQVGRKQLFQADRRSPDQGYYNQNYKLLEKNANNILVNLSKSSPRKTVMNLEQYPAQHVLLDYEIDKIPLKNTKTLANFSKMTGRKGDFLQQNQIIAQTLQNRSYGFKV